MIRAIIFDFFGVLVTEGFRLFCDTYFPNNKEKRLKALKLVNDHDAGFSSQEEYTVELAKLANVSKNKVAEHMQGNKPNQQLLGYIRKELKPLYKIGVLSNSGDDYISHMLSPTDVAIFDDIILSYQHGMTKPNKEIFDLAAKRLGVTPGDCVFIDDSATHYVGAERAGMKPILYENFPKMKLELEKILAG